MEGPTNGLENTLSFDQILTATVRMIRSSWKVPVCAFMQTDDRQQIRIRAADGLSSSAWRTMALPTTEGIAGQCLAKNGILETGALPSSDPLASTINPLLTNGTDRFVLVAVSGEVRALGLLLLGPFGAEQHVLSRDGELRSAGALCAVLSAHWRLYEWISHYLPQVNHELRTPLTAVQGSIGMVLGGMFGELGSEVRQMLEVAQKGCERTVRAIEERLNKETPPSERGGV